MAATIGVFGGSFNPVHNGHLILAQDILEAYELDRILFVPCGYPPHKDPAQLAAAEHRLAMLEQVAELDPRFDLSQIELQREGKSFTIDTLEALQADLPDRELAFIVGSDTLPELRSWHRINDLLHRHRILAPVRPGFDLDTLRAMDFGLEFGWKERLLANLVQGHRVGVSSSDIRMRVAEGMSIRYLVPPEVEMYIFEHGLYNG